MRNDSLSLRVRGAAAWYPYEYCVTRSGVVMKAALKAQHDRQSKWMLRIYAARLLPYERVSCCTRYIKKDRDHVDVCTDGKRAWFRGLQVCGSVWICPICAERLSQARREELQQAIDQAIGRGHGVLLLTLTFSHGIRHRLAQTLPGFTKALRCRLKSGKAWQGLKQQYGLLGSVRALEVTYGENGWHPHSHELLFTARPLTRPEQAMLKNAVYVLWRKAAVASDLPAPSHEHGVDIRGATDAADYVGKWGFASELVRPQAKQGKKKGRNPWALLADYALGDKQAGALFREYAEVFKGRNQLFWSRGLRESLGLREKVTTDLELASAEASESRPETVNVASIDKDTWSLICKEQAHERVLGLAVESKPELLRYLDWLRGNVRLWNGRRAGEPPWIYRSYG